MGAEVVYVCIGPVPLSREKLGIGIRFGFLLKMKIL